MKKTLVTRAPNIGKLHMWVHEGSPEDFYALFDSVDARVFVGYLYSEELFMMLDYVPQSDPRHEGWFESTEIMQVLKTDGTVGWLFAGSDYPFYELTDE